MTLPNHVLVSIITKDGVSLPRPSHPIGEQRGIIPIQNVLDVLLKRLLEDLIVLRAWPEDSCIFELLLAAHIPELRVLQEHRVLANLHHLFEFSVL